MKNILILFFLLLASCEDIRPGSYGLSSDDKNQSVEIFEATDSIHIEVSDKGESIRKIPLISIKGIYFEKKIFNTFEKDTLSYILTLSNRGDTSFVIRYDPSVFPSIPVGSEDRSVTIKRINKDLFYTKKTSLLNDQYFDIYFYNTEYRICAIFFSRINKRFLFKDNRSKYIPEIIPFISSEANKAGITKQSTISSNDSNSYKRVPYMITTKGNLLCFRGYNM